MLILSQFVLRLAFGLALAMTATPARLISSGYYRNNAYVLLALSALASLVAWSTSDQRLLNPWLPTAAAVASYFASAFWLYEKPWLGKAGLTAVAAFSLWSAAVAQPAATEAVGRHSMVGWIDAATGGMVLGTTMAAMLLGHWYLNEPGMPLAPLRRLLGWMAAALCVRAGVCGGGLAMAVAASDQAISAGAWWLFIGLRWLGGIAGTSALIVMSWQTLKVPNTQSATGILYVAVISTFLGELTSLLLSAESPFPL